MSGDYTRFTFDHQRNYAGVLSQQGRVTVDADPNEDFEILDRRWRSETIDIIGQCIVPLSTPHAFEVTPTAPGDFDIGLGRMYVDGLQAENHGLDPQAYDRHLGELSGQTAVPFSDQPHLPPEVPHTIPGTVGTTDLIYIDVWQREVTAIQDPRIREIALGGPDTATRLQTIWQVKALIDVGDVDCPDDIAAWDDLVAPSTGRLTSSTDAAPPGDDPCVIDPSGGYRGVENRLYRIEVHTAGAATDPPAAAPPKFKWSRYNASIAAGVEAMSAGRDELTFATLGRDQVLRFNIGNWIEVLDDHVEYDVAAAGHMAVITAIDEANRIVTIDPPVPPAMNIDPTDPLRHTRAVRWDQQLGVDANGLLDVDSTVGPIDIEKGVRVEFGEGTYKVGDYWVFAARTADGSVEELEQAPPRGIVHHYCRLALITWADPADESEVDDCRQFWPPRGGCCVRVDPDDDLQQIVNMVIGAGGGCICLAPGVHVVDGPLLIREARGLTIHGTGPASVLRLEGVNAQGLGGVVIERSDHVAIHDLFMFGVDTPALVSLRPDGLELNRNVSLRDLTLLNPTAPVPGPAGEPGVPPCAVWAAHAENVDIVDCRLIAVIGILSLFGADLPGLDMIGDLGVAYGRGVRSLHLIRTTIRHDEVGILALLADEWHLIDSDIGPYNREFVQRIRQAVPGGRTLRRFHADLLGSADEVTSPATAPPAGTGIAITGFLWRDCKIDCCRVTGRLGIRALWWLRGGIEACEIDASHAGISIGWIHDASCRTNAIRCELGAGVQFVGCYRFDVKDNRIRAHRGVTNTGYHQAVLGLPQFLARVAVAYGETDPDASVMVLWMFLEETVRATGLTDLRDAAQAVLDTTRLGGSPVMLMLAILVSKELNDLTEEAGGGFEERGDLVGRGTFGRFRGGARRSSAVPIVGLRIAGNDIEGVEACILLEEFMPLGGMVIAHNRLTTTTGQAIAVNANKYLAHVYFVVVLLRRLLAYLSTELLPRLVLSIRGNADPNNDPATMEALAQFVEVLIGHVENWRIGAERFLGADNRIESNTVLSLLTGIESNLYELAIVENHVTMYERRISSDEFNRIVVDWTENSTTRNLAFGMTEGNASYVRNAGESMFDEAALRDDAEARAELSDAVFNAGTGGSDRRFNSVATEVSVGLNNLDFANLGGSSGDLIGIVTEYVSNHGIWVKGAGCRIVENHVLASPDADPTTWARGGVLVWGDVDPSVDAVLLIFANLLARAGRATDALLGTTETLIDNNEIIGGAGHGIDVHQTHTLISQEKYGSLHGGFDNDTLQLVGTIFDLKIRGNHIRDMAGAGVYIAEEAFAVSVDIEGNEIQDCSRHPEAAELTQAKGGIVISNAAYCRIIGNQITRTAANQDLISAFAIDLEAVFGLTISGNRLLFNGGQATGADNGGILLTDVFDEVGIQDNEILDNRGVGLAWGNSDRNRPWGGGDAKLPVELIVPIMVYLQAQLADLSRIGRAGSQGLIQGNRFTVPLISGLQAISLTQLNGINVTGNNFDAHGTEAEQGNVCGVDECLISSNHMLTEDGVTPLKLCGVGRGMISVNVSTAPIRLKVSPGVLHANNLPDVDDS